MRKRFLALLLAGVMLASQVVYAGDEVTDGGAVKESQEVKDKEEISEEMSQIPEQPDVTEKVTDETNELPNTGEEQQDTNNEEIKGNNEAVAKEAAETSEVPEKAEENNEEGTYLEFSKTLYTNYCIVETVSLYEYSGIADILAKGISVVSEDENICTAKMRGSFDYATVFLDLDGKKEGSTTILLKDIEGNTFCKYYVTVKELPKDAADVEDILLRRDIIIYGDRNSDGYVSKSELESMTSLIIMRTNLGSITTLAGLENALNLQSLILSGNSDIQDIGVISKLEKLTYLALDKVPLDDLAFLSGLTNLESLNLQETGISDIDVLGGLPELRSLDLSNNTKLKSIQGLGKLEKLNFLYIDGTSVSAEEEWALADLKDMTISKGDKIRIPEIFGLLKKNSELQITVEGDSQQIEAVCGYGSWSIIGLESGKANLHITYGDLQKDILVTVDGVEPEQEVGEDSKLETEVIEGKGNWENAILNSNGELWETYPEVKRVKSGVKDYLAGWVYTADGTTIIDTDFKYILDNNNILWSGNKKLVGNIKKFDGYYALNEQGILKDIYRENGIEVENVSEWASGIKKYDEEKLRLGVYTYLLKNDGTIWRRLEGNSAENTEQFEQRDNGVIQFTDWGYLKDDGSIVILKGEENYEYQSQVNTKAEKLIGHLGSDKRGFYGANNMLYIINNQLGKVEEIGEIKVQDWSYKADKHLIILSEENELYGQWKGENTYTKIASQVKCINANMAYGDWCYQTEDGQYYQLSENSAEVVETATVMSVGGGTSGRSYELKNQYSGMHGVVLCNGIPLLNSVTRIWCDRSYRYAYALRTDGTIWDISGVPKQIADMTVNDDNLTEEQKENIVGNIESANKGETVQVDMGTAINLPQEVLQAAKNVGTNLEVTLDNGIKWIVDGSSIDKDRVQDTNLQVTRAGKDDGNIPAETFDKVVGERKAEQLNLAHEGEFGFNASLILNADTGVDGLKCVALWNNDGNMELMTSAIVKEGEVAIDFTHASDYMLVYAVNGDVSGDNKLSSFDLMNILHHVTKKKELNALEQGIADYTLDKKITSFDIMKALHAIVQHS